MIPSPEDPEMPLIDPQWCCEMHDNTIRVTHKNSHAKLRITFMRTIRVPDNTTISKLPPGLGALPVFRVRDYAQKLPAAMTAKGGLFMPMYRKCW
jgi:hypothetical protein